MIESRQIRMKRMTAWRCNPSVIREEEAGSSFILHWVTSHFLLVFRHGGFFPPCFRWDQRLRPNRLTLVSAGVEISQSAQLVNEVIFTHRNFSNWLTYLVHEKSTSELISFGFSDRSVRSLVSVKCSANRWVQTKKRLHFLGYLWSGLSETLRERLIQKVKWPIVCCGVNMLDAVCRQTSTTAMNRPKSAAVDNIDIDVAHILRQKYRKVKVATISISYRYRKMRQWPTSKLGGTECWCCNKYSL